MYRRIRASFSALLTTSTAQIAAIGQPTTVSISSKHKSAVSGRPTTSIPSGGTRIANRYFKTISYPRLLAPRRLRVSGGATTASRSQSRRDRPIRKYSAGPAYSTVLSRDQPELKAQESRHPMRPTNPHLAIVAAVVQRRKVGGQAAVQAAEEAADFARLGNAGREA